jgi:hypothetical protein
MGTNTQLRRLTAGDPVWHRRLPNPFLGIPRKVGEAPRIRARVEATPVPTRTLIGEPCPEALADFGLRAALATLGSTFAERTGVRVH